MSMGVYKILNSINGKVYIGSSIDLKGRWQIHLEHLRKKKHHSILLQRAYDKYGENSFIFLIQEKINNSNRLIKREQAWIDYYQSYDPKKGYNINQVAGSVLGHRHSQESKEKIRKASHDHWKNQEFRQKIIAFRKGNPHSDEAKLKMSIIAKEVGKDPNIKHNRAILARKQWENPLFREKMIKGIKENWNKRRFSPGFTESRLDSVIY